MENNRDKLVDDLNLILQENFDYVPAYKVINIADELIKKGWNFNKDKKAENIKENNRYLRLNQFLNKR